MEYAEALRKIIKEARRVVFFGGAGVSTDSGIPDFRGNGGLYTGEQDTDVPPETVLSVEYLYTHPERFFAYYRRHMIYPDATPNPTHLALAQLENREHIQSMTVITQNIDGLHQAAGSKNVLELHGSVHRNYCVKCGKRHDLGYVLNSPDVPRCTACGGMVRPDVVLYGEPLNGRAFYQAQDAVCDADLLIVGGTSLTVYPAASLVHEFSGEHLVIINRTPTAYDGFAEYVIRDSLSEVMTALLQE